MNNFQRITKSINELIKFLVEMTGETPDYWREYLERETTTEDKNEI